MAENQSVRVEDGFYNRVKIVFSTVSG